MRKRTSSSVPWLWPIYPRVPTPTFTNSTQSRKIPSELSLTLRFLLHSWLRSRERWYFTIDIIWSTGHSWQVTQRKKSEHTWPQQVKQSKGWGGLCHYLVNVNWNCCTIWVFHGFSGLTSEEGWLAGIEEALDSIVKITKHHKRHIDISLK